MEDHSLPRMDDLLPPAPGSPTPGPESDETAPTIPGALAPLRFLLSIEYEVVIRKHKDLTPLGFETLNALMASPEALRQMSKIAMQSQLAFAYGYMVDDYYDDPPDAEVFACLKSCLSEEQYGRWEQLRTEEEYSEFTDAFYAVFFSFCTDLCGTSCSLIFDPTHPVPNPWKTVRKEPPSKSSSS